jgi:hypothetical protein
MEWLVIHLIKSTNATILKLLLNIILMQDMNDIKTVNAQ